MQSTKALVFDYQIKRSKRKTVAIHVYHNQVEVRAPLRTPHYFIKDFIAQKQDWILKQLAVQQQKSAEIFAIKHATSIPFLGQTKVLSFQTAAKNKVFLDNDKLVIQGKNVQQPDCTDTNNEAKKLFEAWLKQQAKTHITPKTEALAKKLNLDDRLNAVRFRKTKSKWGHCTAEGLIQYNWLIMMTPEPVVDYLIAHEVCHLAHLNHSPQYYALLASVCEDYQLSCRWLRQHEHRFLF